MFGDLTTLADVKAWLKTAGPTPAPTTDDLLLTRLITAASEFLQNQIARDIASTDYEEQRDGTGGSQFVFANFPVTAVLLVAIPALNLIIPPIPTPTPVLLPGPIPPEVVSFVTPSFGPAGYLFTPTKLVLRGYWVPRVPAALYLQYTAGFQTVPNDLQQACIELVVTRYRAERDHPGVMSTVMQPATTVSYSQKDVNSLIKATLAKYVAVAPVSANSRVMAPTATNPATVIGVI